MESKRGAAEGAEQVRVCPKYIYISKLQMCLYYIEKFEPLLIDSKGVKCKIIEHIKKGEIYRKYKKLKINKGAELWRK